MNLASAAKAAIRRFGVDTGEEPDVIPTGIGPLDRALGGLLPAETMVLGLEQGKGKSSLILEAALSASTPTSILSLEDPMEVWGARTLARMTGIDSRRIRRGLLAEKERLHLEEAQAALSRTANHISLIVDIAADSIAIEKHVRECSGRMVWLDFIQKSRPAPGLGLSRRDYIGDVLARAQKAAHAEGKALGIASQFSRPSKDRGDRPHPSWLKENGDLENEARVIVLGWRQGALLRCYLAKSTWGGEGLEWSYVRDKSGSLIEAEGWE